MVRGDGTLIDAYVRDLPNYLDPGDVMVFNDTRVIPAALKGVRPARDAVGSDVDVDVNLVARESDQAWRALARPGKRLKPGDGLQFEGGLEAEILAKHEDGELALRFSKSGRALDAAIEAVGNMPLPPYIARKRPADATDRETYQKVVVSQEPFSIYLDITFLLNCVL